jgi:hypothetical protein
MMHTGENEAKTNEMKQTNKPKRFIGLRKGYQVLSRNVQK